ncbi:molybdenum cofactor biosynthesis protein MoaE [Alloacidobacterium dinghuense]|uniref:Molybdopterin synthase catalytic subunit n=1 Tax=Alloacidobacterium dinghuense TaxID=2763107 RepID=A0A7G8BM64_9BACT|nr:molybdenum cofactor biosynthesis protein MoaE [Alloacidobacterium dinghuense]QNI33634.1 molybdenum cofactor biosynthesis protein MoaE [Alloacidobacterium dinghuense]
MHVRVLFFGVLKDIFSEAVDSIQMPTDATVATLLDHFRARAPQLDQLWTSLAVAVNQEYALPTQPLADGDEVALLPPVSGGNHTPYIALVREPIQAEALVAQLKQGEDGAVVVFDGIVRNNSRGRRTLYLVYESYEEMALKQMRELAAEASQGFAIRDVLLVHRLGKLEVGETSVLLAVASAHRAAAFDACRWLIDTLKKTVPIWKKEHFEDGAVWADGEPFPAEVKGAPAS